MRDRSGIDSRPVIHWMSFRGVQREERWRILLFYHVTLLRVRERDVAQKQSLNYISDAIL